MINLLIKLKKQIFKEQTQQSSIYFQSKNHGNQQQPIGAHIKRFTKGHTQKQSSGGVPLKRCS